MTYKGDSTIKTVKVIEAKTYQGIPNVAVKAVKIISVSKRTKRVPSAIAKEVFATLYGIFLPLGSIFIYYVELKKTKSERWTIFATSIGGYEPPNYTNFK